MHIVLACLLLLLAGVLLTAMQSKPMAYESNHFILKDSKNKMRGDLCITNTNTESPGLWFFDSAGNQRLFIGLNMDEQPIIYFLNETGDLVENIGLAGKAGAVGKIPDKAKILWPRDIYKIFFVENRVASKVFHQKKCPKTKGKIMREITVKLAQERGMVPCKECCKSLYR